MQMVTVYLVELNFTGLVKGFQADVVLLVELRFLEWLNFTGLFKSLEPGCLFGVNHRVFGEHREEAGVDFREFVFSQFGIVTGSLQLVIESWKERGFLHIRLVIVNVPEVTRRSKPILRKLRIQELFS